MASAFSIPGWPQARRYLAKRTRTAWAVRIVALSLLIHLPLVVNDGIYQDDWRMAVKLPGQGTESLGFILDAGHFIFYAIISALAWIGDPLVILHVLGIVAIPAIALALATLFERTGTFTREESAWIALLAIAYPAIEVWPVRIIAMYAGLILFCFLLGANLLYRLAASGAISAQLRTIALVCFFVSFAQNQLIILYYLVLIYIVMTVGGTAGLLATVKASPKAALRKLARYADFLVLPVIYLVCMSILAPRRGNYKDYYAIKWPSLSSLSDGLAAFVDFGFIRIWSSVFATISYPAIFILFLIVAAVFACVMLIARPHYAEPSRAAILKPIWLALALFAIMVAPYLAAQSYPSVHFFSSRLVILLAVPLALLLIALARCLALLRGSRLATVVLSLCLVGFGFVQWANYAFLQARWAKLQGLGLQLKAHSSEPAGLVFAVHDEFDSPFGNRLHNRHHYYGIFELTGLLHSVYGNHPFVAFSSRNEGNNVLRVIQRELGRARLFFNMRIDGPQVFVTIGPGPAFRSNAELALRYTVYRLLSRERLVGYLRDSVAVQVQVGPIPRLLKPHSSTK